MVRLMLVCLAFSMNIAAQANVLLGESNSLDGKIDVLHDPLAILAINDVAQPDIAKAFTRLRGQPNLGFLHGYIWLRVTLIRPQQKSPLWWLEMNSGLIDEAVLYMPKAGGGWIRRISGDLQPWTDRDIEYRNPVFKLDLPTDQPVTLYLKLRSKTTMSVSLNIWSTEEFIDSSNTRTLIFGLLLGMHLFLIITNIWVFYATREGSSGLFALYTLNSGLAVLGSQGLIYQYLLHDWPQLNGAIQLASHVFLIPIGLTFYLNFLGLLKSRRLSWAMYYWYVIWTIALSTLMMAWASETEPDWLRPAYLIWVNINSLLIYLITIWLAFKRHLYARQLVWAATMLWFGILLRVGRNSGLLQPTLMTDQLYWVASVGFLVALNYLLNRRHHNLRDTKEKAQAHALYIAQTSEQYLQTQVSKRTQALQEALSQLKTSLDSERQAHEDQRRFFSTVSHELRTPLAVIDAVSKNLELDGIALDSVTRRRYEKIQSATEQLVVLVKNCFREDRFELLDRGSRCETIDLNEMLFEVRNSALISDKNHEVRINSDKLSDFIQCDQELTQFALRNLMSNAAKYSPPGSLIILHGYSNLKGTMLQVTDNGPGVSAIDLPNLFRRYYRGENSNFIPGTGLGLPLARELIQMQGGSLTIDSTPGKGFRANIWLPISQIALSS
jgi:signal transduction histidine kinase